MTRFATNKGIPNYPKQIKKQENRPTTVNICKHEFEKKKKRKDKEKID